MYIIYTSMNHMKSILQAATKKKTKFPGFRTPRALSIL